MKKSFAMIAVVLLVCAVSTCFFEVANANETVQLKDIDVYLIAGQSNAVGYTKVDSDEERAEIAKDSRITNGFDNVKYYGYVECDKNKTLPSDIPFRTVKLGKGDQSTGKTRETTYDTFGPEMGMAQYLTENGGSDEYGIIKYAAGGTAIYDEFTSTMGSQYGNWMSPSLIAKYGKGSATLTGLCYNNFLQTVRQGVQAYKDNGYNPVIKGMVWMQGESESQSSANSKIYAELLGNMVADMRKDLTEITSQDLSELTVVAAKIPSKYKTLVDSAKYVDVVRAQTDAAAESDVDLLLIDNDFVTLPGTDNHHYNVPDMLQVGRNFAEKLIESSSGTMPKVKVVCTDGGHSDVVSKRAAASTTVAVTLTPESGYELSSFEFVDANGKNVTVTARKVGNVIRFVMPSTNVVLNVDFVRIPSFSVTVYGEHGNVYRTNSQRLPFRGETVTFTFKPENGYELDKVTVNGVEVQTDKTYQYPTYTTEVGEALDVKATFKLVQSNDDEPQPDKPQKKGCNGVVSCSSVVSIVACCAAVTVLVKKK